MSSDLPPLQWPQTASSINGNPCLLEATSRHFGHEAALAVWQAFAGRNYYVPLKMTPRNELARIIGFDQACVISRELSGVSIAVLTLRKIRTRRVLRLHRTGISISEIAKRTGYSERNVYKIIKEARRCGLIPLSREPAPRRRLR